MAIVATSPTEPADINTLRPIMHYPLPLQPARLIKRYKRFLADVQTEQGQFLTAHCPNTGTMTACAEPDSRVWVWDSKSTTRKYPFTWEIVEVAGEFLACINTQRANHLIEEALQYDRIEALLGYPKCQREVKYHGKHRIDFLLSGEQGHCYVEVKSVTWWQGEGLGIFPDAITERGQQHLLALIEMVKTGHRAVLLFCAQHTGIQHVKPATEKDPVYAATLAKAIAAGVEVYALGVHIDAQQIYINKQITFSL